MKALEVVRDAQTEFRSRRAAALEKMEAIADRAMNANRNLTADESDMVEELRSTVETIDDELDALEAREADLIRRRERSEKIAQRPSLHVTRRGDDNRGRALTMIERSGAPGDGSEWITTAIERDDAHSDGLAVWASATADPAYRGAFGKLIADPLTANARFTAEEGEAFARVEELRAINTTTSADGGYMVPFSLDPSVLITSAGVVDPMRTIGRRVPVASDVWHGVSSAGVTASWDAELEQVSDDTPTFAQPTITPHRLTAFIPFSIEAQMDVHSLENELTTLMADAFTTAEGTGFWTGAGDASNQPRGLITALDANTNVELVTTTSGTFTQVDVYGLLEAVPARFRRNATWAASLPTLHAIRRMGEGTTGSNSAFWADLGADTPPLLLGKPVVEADAFDDWADSTAAGNFLTVGDFSRYVLPERVGTRVELVPHLFGANNRPNGSRGLFAYRRVGGDSVTDTAFRLLQQT